MNLITLIKKHFELPSPESVHAARKAAGDRRHAEDRADLELLADAARLSTQQNVFQLSLDLEEALSHYEQTKIRLRIAQQRLARLSGELS